MRLMRQVAFDRMLARLFIDSNHLFLKGGYSLELRLTTARTTKDMDLTLLCAFQDSTAGIHPEKIRNVIQNLSDRDLGDTFRFTIDPPTLEIKGAPYGGARFPVESRMAGRTFVRFNIDVGVGEAMIGSGEMIEGRDWLGFAGISPPRIVCISKEQQFSEKLHAYTMPDRPTQNSRVKDLVDMVLLLTRFELDKVLLIHALHTTYARRRTHELTTQLCPPPESWTIPFAQLARETGLGIDVVEAFRLVQNYLKTLHN